MSTEGSEYWTDLLPGTTWLPRIMGVLALTSPHWPAHVPKSDELHLDLAEHHDSPTNAVNECSKERDASCVARADAHHESLSPDAEPVTRVRYEKCESRHVQGAVHDLWAL